MIRGIEKLSLNTEQIEGNSYYDQNNYSNTAVNHKKELIRTFLKEIQPASVWDFGANDGTYSLLALEQNAHVIAFDIDHRAVERNYAFVKKNKLHMLPLVIDLTNPSPGIGFANLERVTIEKRQKSECLMMLALIHHLCIANNLPLNKLASWLAGLCDHLIIEFIPKEDSQVQILLANRTDIFLEYNQNNFEDAFSLYFQLKHLEKILESSRILYWYEKKKP
jgi:ribosomal protein L11 methylase PrmA